MTPPTVGTEREREPRKYFGNAAHFIGGESCRFHIATQIGDALISTVGEYRSRESEEMQEIGYNRFFETMVFRVNGQCGCGCGLSMHTGRELDFAGYMTADGANAGHEAMCQKYEITPLSAPTVSTGEE